MTHANTEYGPEHQPNGYSIRNDERAIKLLAKSLPKQLRIDPKTLELLLIDLDQTLIQPPDYEVPHFTQGVFNDIRRRTEVVTTLMTGRHPGSAEPYLDLLGIETYFIATHGARVQRKGLKPIYVESIHDNSAKKIHEIFYKLREEGLTEDKAVLLFFQGNVAAHETSNSKVLKTYEKRNGNLQFWNVGPKPTFDVYKRNELPEKIVIATDSKERAAYVKQELQKRIDDATIQYLIVNETQVEIIRSDVSKGFGARHILKELRIKPQNALAFGDGFTDLTVVNEGIPLILLGNAPKDVKAAARDLEARVAIVPLTVDDEAVAKIAKALILNGYT